MDQDENNKEEVYLNLALKDSNEKVQDEQQRPAQTFDAGTPKVIQWAIKYSGGLVKDEKQARYVVIGLVVVVIIVSLFLVFSGGGSSGADLRQQRLYPPGSPIIQ